MTHEALVAPQGSRLSIMRAALIAVASLALLATAAARKSEYKIMPGHTMRENGALPAAVPRWSCIPLRNHAFMAVSVGCPRSDLAPPARVDGHGCVA